MKAGVIGVPSSLGMFSAQLMLLPAASILPAPSLDGNHLGRLIPVPAPLARGDSLSNDLGSGLLPPHHVGSCLGLSCAVSSSHKLPPLQKPGCNRDAPAPLPLNHYGHSFCKGPHKKYFRICGADMISATYSSLCLVVCFNPLNVDKPL